MTDLLSAGKVAKALDVPPKAVKAAIEALKLEPDVVKGNCKYYTKESMEKIKNSVK